MALQLNLDGKTIGQLDESGKLQDTDGKPVVAPQKPAVDEPEKLTVPLNPFERQIQQDVKPDDNDPDPDKPKGDNDGDPFEGIPAPLKSFVVDQTNTLVATQKQNKLLQDSLNQLSATIRQSNQTPAQVEEIIKDSIPDGLDKEKDPFGLAQTIKGMVKALNTMNTKVNRLDQNAGYQAGVALMEAEKSKHAIFKDKKLSSLADKVLQSELCTSSDPMALIVQRVADQFEEVGAVAEKEYVKEKIKRTEKVPQSVRRSDGATAAITVDKPKNVAEASKAYAAWRTASTKARRGQ